MSSSLIGKGILNTPIIKSASGMHLWAVLHLMARDTDGQELIGNQVVNCPKGSLVTSRPELAEMLNLHQSKVERLLNTFEKLSIIEQQTNSKYRIIAIYKTGKCTETGQQTNSKRTADEQQTKKVKPKKELDYSSWPELPSDEIMEGWLQSRKFKKLQPVSQIIINTLAKELHKAAAAGFTVDQCLTTYIEGKMQRFKADWMKNETNNRNNGYERESKQSRVKSRLDEIAANDIKQNGFTYTLDN